jgi:hypothetical protein
MIMQLYIAIAILAILAAVIFFISRTKPRLPAEPIDDAPVTAGLKPRPRKGRGAVALDEPEDDLDTDAYSRR